MAWGAGSYQRPADWKRTVRRILRRDPTCRIAGPRCTRRSTEVDHAIPVWQGGAHHDGNLRGVCHQCHAEKTKVESAQARAQAQRLSRKRPTEAHPGAV